MRTQVFITIDTEFSIGGAFSAPTTRKPIGAQNVLGDVQGESQALGFMLKTFRTHGLRATFFTEALQTAYFGDEQMGALARRIAAEGHDLQLHLHPVWTYFDQPDWPSRLKVIAPNDDLHGRSVEQLTAWMQRGIDTFTRWGLPAPVALRTGNLMVDRNVYRAMRQVGLTIASNVGRAVFEPEEAALRFNDGVHQIEGITEIPVLTYSGLRLGRRVERKSLTITGSSAGEAICLLERAHQRGSRAVVLLTHCHEFVKGDMSGTLQPNRLNQRRLESLCRFLREADDRFEVTTMNRMAEAERDPPTASPPPLLAVPAHMAMTRMLQNKLSDHNVI